MISIITLLFLVGANLTLAGIDLLAGEQPPALTSEQYNTVIQNAFSGSAVDYDRNEIKAFAAQLNTNFWEMQIETMYGDEQGDVTLHQEVLLDKEVRVPFGEYTIQTLAIITVQKEDATETHLLFLPDPTAGKSTEVTDIVQSATALRAAGLIYTFPDEKVSSPTPTIDRLFTKTDQDGNGAIYISFNDDDSLLRFSVDDTEQAQQPPLQAATVSEDASDYPPQMRPLSALTDIGGVEIDTGEDGGHFTVEFKDSDEKAASMTIQGEYLGTLSPTSNTALELEIPRILYRADDALRILDPTTTLHTGTDLEQLHSTETTDNIEIDAGETSHTIHASVLQTQSEPVETVLVLDDSAEAATTAASHSNIDTTIIPLSFVPDKLSLERRTANDTDTLYATVSASNQEKTTIYAVPLPLDETFSDETTTAEQIPAQRPEQEYTPSDAEVRYEESVGPNNTLTIALDPHESTVLRLVDPETNLMHETTFSTAIAEIIPLDQGANLRISFEDGTAKSYSIDTAGHLELLPPDAAYTPTQDSEQDFKPILFPTPSAADDTPKDSEGTPSLSEYATAITQSSQLFSPDPTGTLYALDDGALKFQLFKDVGTDKSLAVNETRTTVYEVPKSNIQLTATTLTTDQNRGLFSLGSGSETHHFLHLEYDDGTGAGDPLTVVIPVKANITDVTILPQEEAGYTGEGTPYVKGDAFTVFIDTEQLNHVLHISYDDAATGDDTAARFHIRAATP